MRRSCRKGAAQPVSCQLPGEPVAAGFPHSRIYKGDPRLARLRTLIRRAEQRCGPRAAELHQAHRYLLEIAQRLEPPMEAETGAAVTGCGVRQRVEAVLDDIAAAVAAGRIPDWLQPPLAHLMIVLRLRDHLLKTLDLGAMTAKAVERGGDGFTLETLTDAWQRTHHR